MYICRRMLLVLLPWLPLTAVAQVIDPTPTRVQTSLRPGLGEPLGALVPKDIREVGGSSFTIGCEVLDREYTDYDSYKEYLAPLGLQRMRIQGGWARCEKDKGIYDFGWLDHIIHDATRRGMEVCFELSYGNPAYLGGGGRTLADGIPSSEEGLQAWDRWVETTCRRYKDKVKIWTVWNEPDLHGNNDIQPCIDFNLRTAAIVKRIIPDARLGGLVLTHAKMDWCLAFARRLRQEGQDSLFEWIAYHHYTRCPEWRYGEVEKVMKEVHKMLPRIKFWQNESGTHSEYGLSGALKKYPWTELTQAKWHTRRMLGDLSRGIESGVFCIADMDYRTTSFHNGRCPYGLIKNLGAADGFRVVKVKTAYYAVQNVVSVFNNFLQRIPAHKGTALQCDSATYLCTFRHLSTDTEVAAFWRAGQVPQDDNLTTPATLTLSHPLKEPVWVDCITGLAYAIPQDRIRTEQGRMVLDVPLYDAPAFVCERSILTLQPLY